ncbi:uncharacterized protein MYCGRDRAFT_44495 [Zymoseptoria tritici IPO323]|uniref:Uncharacterized protein n=1 Tax=Zymoseptoria tritici (strain CBS 115943 / IPO323) TaxID=336722 RepID=F9XCV5_ZYMTI|nr:uncharacterized protein MYCGRDRAFT_44495 [Zymoseptoria tritici IPO323]EGP86902.1 hypothetical protein MYCGRDRAFT_44495 [Zymoseptoria tritici IPO323]
MRPELQPHSGHHINDTRSPCGDSPEEARDNHCAFDLLSFSWLPQRCYDAEISAEFLNHSDWSWYKQGYHSASELEPEPVHQSIVEQGGTGDLYVTGSYHLVHCLYMWRKLHRGMEVEARGLKPGISGAWIDSYTRDFAHTHHCSQYILDLERRTHTASTASTDKSLELVSGALRSELDAIKVRIRTKYPGCPSEHK